LVQIISGGLGECLGLCVDDRVAIDVVDTNHDWAARNDTTPEVSLVRGRRRLLCCGAAGTDVVD